ncbi:hypothetical protein TKK_0011069 [Trichogramma kaykai]|uniref:G-protein coupled receptors family 1 profile domain-containing protein n=1 Tax=Trichogramma kaykai TaxID=54128 RepID=A0ABD2WUD9_9HYME
MSQPREYAGDPTTNLSLMIQNCCQAAENCSSACDDITTSNRTFQIALSLLYLLIFLCGLIGNLLVFVVVVRNRRMQTVTNLFIANLALSDILLCTMAVPFTPLYTFSGRWVFGEFLCHCLPFAQGMSIYISTFTLTSIAVDRFFVILYPFRPRMKINTCLGIVVLVWLVAAALTAPYGMYMRHYGNEEEHYFCEENWPEEKVRTIFSVITTSLQFLVPFVVIAICYVCVSVKLSNRMRPGNKSSSRREEIDRMKKKKTNNMLILMVVVFVLSWMPLNLINIVEDFEPKVTDWSYYKVLFFVAHCIAMSSTCYNPFLYTCLNDSFRKEFAQCGAKFLNSIGCSRFAKQASDYKSNTANTGGPDGIKAGDCYGNDPAALENTVQESLIPLQGPDKQRQDSTCEMITLEPMTNNYIKDV